MIFGNIEGLVRGTQSLAFYHEVTGSAVSSISTGNILNGDEDGWYTIIVRYINAYAGNNGFYIQPNGDTTTSHYGHRHIAFTNTTVADDPATSSIGMFTGYGTSTYKSCLSITRLYAKSGSVRIGNTFFQWCDGTTVTQGETGGCVWNDTSNPIASITLKSQNASGIGVGTELFILKDNNFTNGTPTGVITTPYIKGAWVRVGSQVLDSAATSVTFSGLDGDRQVLYYYSMQYKNAYNGAINVSVRLNNDTGNNYGTQSLYAENTTVSAARAVYTGINGTVNYCAAQNNYTMASGIIFAKSGFIRPAIAQVARSISGTTVTDIIMQGASWNNTTDNITEFRITSDRANSFNTGSQFDLYALYQ